MQVTGQRKKKVTPPPEVDKAAASPAASAAAAPREATPPPQEQRVLDASHIALMEPALALAATVPFSSLNDDVTGAGVTQLKSILAEYGFAIVQGVLSPAEVAHLEALWAQDLMSIIDTEQSDPTLVATLAADPIHRWPLQELSLGTKFATLYGLPHGQMAWATRTHPNVKRVYERIYGTDALVVGTDNIFFDTRSSAEKDDSARQSDLWPHADQNQRLQPSGKWEVYQGVVYLWPTGIDTSATVVHPGSHNDLYHRLMKTTNDTKHFCPLPKSWRPEFVEGARRATVPAGAMLLWSSKTIHQGWPHGPRLAVPVCFEPRSRRTAEAYKTKVGCVWDGVPTSHWASLGIRHPLTGKGSHDGTETTPWSGVVLKDAAHLHCRAGADDLVEAIRCLL